MHDNSIAQFTDKYQKSGSIGQYLLRNFFKTIARIVPRESVAIAEIGCGAGYSTKKLHTLFPRATFFASDIDPALVELTRSQNPDIQTNVESIYALGSPDNAFDLVFCLEVLEHLEDPDKALRELARVSRSHVVISVPREPLWHILNVIRGAYWKHFGNTPGHLNHWSKRSFVRFVGTEFDIVEVASSLPWTIILAKKK